MTSPTDLLRAIRVPDVRRFVPAVGQSFARGLRTASGLEVEVGAQLPLLPQLADQLSDTSTQIEKAITDICCTFQGMATRAQASVAQAEAITGGGEGAGSRLLDTLAGARASFDVLLTRLTSASDRARSASERVQSLESLASRVEKGIAQVDAIARTVRLLALNAKIEAGRDGGNSGAGFSVVATEMERCARESSGIADTIGSTAQELTATLTGVAEALRAEADRAAEDMVVSRQEIESALQSVEGAHDAIRRQMDDAGRFSQELAGEISSAVVALQFQDRVSQRIGHVVQALRDMHAAIDLARPRARDLDARVEQRREEVAAQIAAAHTMAEERVATTGAAEPTVASGDVELF